MSRLFFLLLLFSATVEAIFEKQTVIIGAGYVGLITGCCLADTNKKITCVDTDISKIEKAAQGIPSIYEPGLRKLLKKGLASGYLNFSHDIESAIRQADVIFIAVGTPTKVGAPAKNVDLSHLQSALKTISHNLSGYTIVCIKSTVPAGTHLLAHTILEQYKSPSATFDLIANPEFLREGSAIQDFFTKNPIVIGSASSQASKTMKELYEDLLREELPYIETDYITAELLKYAWNNFSALRICYVNELALLSRRYGADITTIIKILELSQNLLPTNQLKPGPGIGGSCLIKDNDGLVEVSNKVGLSLPLVSAITQSNNYLHKQIINRIDEILENDLTNKTISILGLAYKANTNDTRYSAALPILETCIKKGAHIKAYDPHVKDNLSLFFPGVKFCTSAIEATRNSNLVILVTEWNEFLHLDYKKIKSNMNAANILDARRYLDRHSLKKIGYNIFYI